MKLELREITVSPEIFDRSVMMSSLIPSEKYSCSGSPDMLVNGKTAIDDFLTWEPRLAAWDGRSRRVRIAGMPRPDADRTVDVLDIDVAAVPEANVNPVADAFVDDGGDANPAGFGERLQARRNVDAIAIDVIALDNDVAEIDADSKHDGRLGAFGAGTPAR